MKVSSRGIVLAAALAAAPIAGCSATQGERNTESGAGAGAAGTGGFGIGGGSPGAPSGCSADLQKVVHDDGSESACPPDQGCDAGKCVPACDAAASSKGSIGCDFWAPDPPFFGNGLNGDPSIGLELAGPCYAVFVANAWSRPAKITVKRNGQALDVTQFGKIPKGIVPNVTYEPIPASGLPAGEVGVLFLSHRPGVHNNRTSLECPVAPAILDDAGVQRSGKGSGFHVTLDTPVSAYDIVPYGGADSWLPSATLLFPATAWGTNYYAMAPHGISGPLWMAIVAAQDGTEVQVAPPVTLPGGGTLPAAPQGQVTSVTLGAGEFAQWLGADPSAAVLQANKPIGVWTGNAFLNVSSKTSPMGGGQDSAHQQLPHVKALGSEYVGPGIVTRLPSHEPESIPYRLLGVVDGTALTWDPSPSPLAPVSLAAGQVVEFETTAVFSVRSQDGTHPFALTQYMPGTMATGTVDGCSVEPCNLGDEEWVELLPPKQFLSRYVFFTDPTYSTTNLVLTRVKGESGFADVELACLGKVEGWKPVGSGGRYEYAQLDLVRGGVASGNCGVSRHEAKSAGAFGVMVWGTDYYSSYAYPAGGNVGIINDVVVPPVPK